MKTALSAMALALTATAVTAEDTVTIEFAYPYSHLFDVTYEAMMPAFKEAHPNIDVKFRATYESYEDGTNTILRDRRFGREIPPEMARESPAHLAPFLQVEAHSLLDAEPPRHTRLRRRRLRRSASGAGTNLRTNWF